jgi:hypothetical protein
VTTEPVTPGFVIGFALASLGVILLGVLIRGVLVALSRGYLDTPSREEE